MQLSLASIALFATLIVGVCALPSPDKRGHAADMAKREAEEIVHPAGTYYVIKAD
ncbi:hypothetical protein BV22DRAFT_1127438 [Leucogyrophana mollusca]|uniref:Uncharacterized protein n=1 Tax=Leucogyrophana mollusca TaxID=85980 RepID=A0ACB8BNB8_9AGAM|nr:hypothetical protein BV22DRAFT_1127438 [Leucogyrophana mollusca]